MAAIAAAVVCAMFWVLAAFSQAGTAASVIPLFAGLASGFAYRAAKGPRKPAVFIATILSSVLMANCIGTMGMFLAFRFPYGRSDPAILRVTFGFLGLFRLGESLLIAWSLSLVGAVIGIFVFLNYTRSNRRSHSSALYRTGASLRTSRSVSPKQSSASHRQAAPSQPSNSGAEVASNAASAPTSPPVSPTTATESGG
ncbi:MAG: hypothetical protein LBH11_03250 [Propionibacteriaceae bacterium]|nr:hypothetical protein [Propionibacteriaceae bacterium]